MIKCGILKLFIKWNQVKYFWEDQKKRKESSEKILKLRGIGGGCEVKHLAHVVMVTFCKHNDSAQLRSLPTWWHFSVVSIPPGDGATSIPYSGTIYCLHWPVPWAQSSSRNGMIIHPLGSWHPKDGLGTRSVSTPWEVVRSVESQVPPLTH